MNVNIAKGASTMQYVYQLAEYVDAGELHLEDLFDLRVF